MRLFTRCACCNFCIDLSFQKDNNLCLMCGSPINSSDNYKIINSIKSSYNK